MISGDSPVNGNTNADTGATPLDVASQRDALLRRVREATHRGRQYRVRLPDDIPEDIGYLGVEGSLSERLVDELKAVGSHAYIVSSVHHVADTVRELVSRFQVTSAVCWQHPLLKRCEIHRVLDELKVDVIMHDPEADRSDERRRLFRADLGVSSVDWAVAETGTLALCCSPGQPPTASLVPPVHLAVVEPAQILPDLFDLFAKLERDGLPSNLALITGPSKTGDIELKLTTGVHGPGEVHVVILDELDELHDRKAD